MPLALLIASLVATAIGTIPGIPTGIAAATGSISSVLGVLIKNGVGSSSSASASTIVIASLQAIIAQLKNTQGLPASALADITLLDDALTAAVAENAAIVSVDPTKLLPITPVA
jgi:hypothetical protein